MTAHFVINVFLPTLVPLGIGYALARWTRLSPEPLRRVARYVLLPVLLFLTLLGPLPQRTGLIALAAGAGMALAGLLLVQVARRWFAAYASGAATQPNIAGFALPFLALSWEANPLGIRFAAFAFVGAAAVVLVAQGKAGLRVLVREPWLYAVGAALVLGFVGVPRTVPERALGPLATACYPLVLVYLGTLLHPATERWDRLTLVAIVARLGTGLAIVAVANAIVPLPRMAFEAALIIALAPPATAAQALVGEPDSHPGRPPLPAGTLVSTLIMAVLLVTDW